MIWLPGILSQGGKKFTWGRYTLKAVVVVGGTGTGDISNDGYTTSYGTGYTFDENTGKFTITGVKHSYIGDYKVGSVTYHNSSRNSRDENLEEKTFTTIYEWTITNVTSSQITWDYKALTAVQGKGTFVDTVEASDPSAYPDNGKQGNYWYVRYADTPLTWKRYTLTEGEVQGESVTQTATSTTYFYRATSYSRSGKTFTATGTRTRASSLAVGDFLIQSNGAFVSSTNMSGDALFKITGKSGSSTVSLTFDTYTVGDVKGSYLDTVSSYNPHEYPDNGAQDGYWYVGVESGGATPEVNYVGYIQSNGTQYINTEFTPNQNTRVVWEGEFSKVGNTWLFGTREDLNVKAFALFYWTSNSCYTVDYGADRDQFATSLPVVTTVDFNKNVVTVNGSFTVTSDASTFTAPKPLFLFANNNNGTVTGMATVKTKTCKIYDNGVLVRHYKASLDPDGVACLYDEVNGEYVYNAGSGTFAYGTDA